ncbi:MAG: radical SAM protein [Myxococcota bacterium]
MNWPAQSPDLVAHAPLVLVPQHFGSLVFDRSTSRYLPFDVETTALLRALIDRPPHQMVTEVEDPEAFVAFHASIDARGLCAPDGRFAGAVLDVTPPADHLTGPLALHLEIIGACNLACTHCFAGELPRHHAPLRLPEIVDLFDQLAAIGSYRLGLTGGEPLMRKDLFEIIDEAGQRGLHPCLTTNGLLLDEVSVRKLGERDFAWLNVSLDGATAATNDAVRGAGVFDAVCDKLRLLGRYARFTLAFTITSLNAAEVDACVRLAWELGAHTAVFRPLYPTGIALRHPELMPTYDQYADALERLEQVGHLPIGHEVCGVDPFSPQTRRETQARTSTWPGCGAGTTVCSISVQGQVNPCSFMGPEHDAGNIRDQPFRAIWDTSQGFQAVRNPALDGCGSGCDGFQGGCRARAKAAHGSIHAADPWLDAYRNRVGGHHPKTNIHLSSRRGREGSR